MTLLFFFFNDTATTEIYTLSLHDALPISLRPFAARRAAAGVRGAAGARGGAGQAGRGARARRGRGRGRGAGRRASPGRAAFVQLGTEGVRGGNRDWRLLFVLRYDHVQELGPRGAANRLSA